MSTLPILLNAIPVDIVEMIIVSSRDYKLFKELQDVIYKLQEPSRVSRINDKLTITELTKSYTEYIYYLNGNKHKEYDKPARILKSGTHDYCINDNCNRKNDHPAFFYSSGSRYWFKNNLEHRKNDLPRRISDDGRQEWMIDGVPFRENNNSDLITSGGHRYYGYKITYIVAYLI